MRRMRFLLFGIMIGVLAPNSFAQGVPAPKSDNVSQQDQVKTIFSFKDEIGLSDDQELKLKALLYDEQSLIDTDNNTLKTLGTELNDMIEKKEDMQLIKNKLEAMSKIQVEVSYRNIEDSRKVETILTPDQIDKWRDIQKKFAPQAR